MAELHCTGGTKRPTNGQLISAVASGVDLSQGMGKMYLDIHLEEMLL